MLESWNVEVPAAGERHEIVIVVGVSAVEAAAAVKDVTIAELSARFAGVDFTITGLNDDFVDGGRFMVVGCRGSVGDGGKLKPMPPYQLMLDVDQALLAMGFLEPPKVH